MPRKKSSAAVVKSAPSTVQKHKRQLSSTATPHSTTSATPSRSSKRLKTAAQSSPASKATPTKSKYFEHSDEDEENGDEEEEANNSGSGYEDEDASQTESSDATSEESDDSEEDTRRSKKRQQSKQTNGSPQHAIKGKKDLWREGVKTGLGPGKAVYIEKPKARGDGGIKYVPEKLHPNTFEFLKDLKKNNDRIWFKAHDPDYRASWKDFESFVETLSEKIAEIDDTVPELPAKDLFFRVYRDIRFSKNPQPYKNHFSAAFSRTGRKGPYACYYVHIEPGGNCFVGSGLWHPDAAPVALLRADIDQRPERIRDILTSSEVRKYIFGGVSKDAKKAIKAFCKHNQENALKTKPKVWPSLYLSLMLR